MEQSERMFEPEPETPAQSVHEHDYWPVPKIIYHNLAELQAHLNRRVQSRFCHLEKVTEALLAEHQARFESDHVPEVVSPPPEWNHTFLQHKWKFPGQPIPSTKEVLDSLACFINPPLVKDELLLLYDDCIRLCDVAGDRLQREFDVERARIERFIQSDRCVLETYNFSRDLEFGEERLNIVTRHFIKRRWQTLGIWEESWGIPGRYYEWSKDRDDISHWPARWRTDLRTLDKEAAVNFTNDFVVKRKTLSRGQQHAIAPHQRLDTKSSPSEVWGFITSRPWFVWEAGKAEELIRFSRVSRSIREMFSSRTSEPGDLKALHNRVAKMWKDRSTRAAEWPLPPEDGRVLPGWWWPHEEETCEEEHLAILNNIEQLLQYSTTSALEYTPSECEALTQMAPDEAAPIKRSKKRVRFEEAEDKKWNDSKEASNAAIDKYAQEARQYAGLLSSAYKDGNQQVENLNEVTESSKAIILPQEPELAVCSRPQLGMSDVAESECRINHYQRQNEDPTREINFFEKIEETHGMSNEQMPESFEAETLSQEATENSVIPCEEAESEPRLDNTQPDDLKCLVDDANSMAPSKIPDPPALSDSLDSLLEEAKPASSQSQSGIPVESVSGGVGPVALPTKSSVYQANSSMAKSFGLTYGYETATEARQLSPALLPRLNSNPTAEETTKSFTHLWTAEEEDCDVDNLEVTTDGFMFPKFEYGGIDHSMFKVTDPFHQGQHSRADSRSGESGRQGTEWDDDLVSPKTRPGAENLISTMPVGSIEDGEERGALTSIENRVAAPEQETTEGTLSQAREVHDAPLPCGTKRKHSTSETISISEMKNPSQPPLARGQVEEPAMKRVKLESEPPSALEDRIPGLEELNTLLRRADATKRGSPLRQTSPPRVPLPDAPTNASGYDGDDELSASPQGSSGSEIHREQAVRQDDVERQPSGTIPEMLSATIERPISTLLLVSVGTTFHTDIQNSKLCYHVKHLGL